MKHIKPFNEAMDTLMSNDLLPSFFLNKIVKIKTISELDELVDKLTSLGKWSSFRWGYDKNSNNVSLFKWDEHYEIPNIKLSSN